MLGGGRGGKRMSSSSREVWRMDEEKEAREEGGRR